jgi:SAM-dependent methyltransferase
MPGSTSESNYKDQTGAACRICGSHELDNLEAREMMFGLRERFQYWECRTCGCVQISSYLPNIEKYYPPNYYSFSSDASEMFYQREPGVKKYARSTKVALINAHGWSRRRFLRSNATRQWLASRPVAEFYLKYFPNPDARILDVGCGGGNFLQDLHYLYYTNIHGCDPFIADDIYHDGRILIRKAWLHELEGFYDCISFHHVFEHMPDQLAVLSAARERLAPDGLLMIRIPVVGGEAWRSYRGDWVQLDPPRHYYLHSERSFSLLAEQAGLQIESIEYDSFAFQFWGSEMYQRDIPLMEVRAPGKSIGSFFSAEALADYETRANRLNQLRDGDQIIAILRKKKDHVPKS